MSATSKNVYDINKWIKKVFDSCVTVEQWQTASQLKRIYNKYEIPYELQQDLSHYAAYTYKRIVENETIL